jgi:cytochrome P450
MEEVLRLWGPINVCNPRVSPGRTLGEKEVFVPKGTVVATNAFTTARDPSLFPDPDAFKPERWFKPTAAMKKNNNPFSIGPRNCIGKHLAEVQLSLTLARIYQLYDVSADPSITAYSMRHKDRGVMEPWAASLPVTASSAK